LYLLEAHLIDLKKSDPKALQAFIEIIDQARAIDRFMLPTANAPFAVERHPDMKGYRRFLKQLFAYIVMSGSRGLQVHIASVDRASRYNMYLGRYPLLTHKPYNERETELRLPPLARLVNHVLAYMYQSMDGYVCVIAAAIKTGLDSELPQLLDHFRAFFDANKSASLFPYTRHMRLVCESLFQ